MTAPDAKADRRERRDIAFHLDRLNAWLVDLWSANNLTLHMCDGTVRTGQRGLLQNIRDDVMALRDAKADKNGWRSDMENAPRDGSEILAFDAAGVFLVVEWWSRADGMAGWISGKDANDGSVYFAANKIKKWQPLPAPPVSDGG